VLVDKPVGWTSFDVVGKLRGTLRQSMTLKKARSSFAPQYPWPKALQPSRLPQGTLHQAMGLDRAAPLRFQGARLCAIVIPVRVTRCAVLRFARQLQEAEGLRSKAMKPAAPSRKEGGGGGC
jgi:hypothetical protein